MMVEYLRAASIKTSVALATALFYGVKVDTQNFQKQNMFNIANLNLVRKFELTQLRRSELRYFRIALNEVKASKRRAYVHIGKVSTPDILVIIADFFNRVDAFDWVIVSGIHGEKLVVIFRCDGYRKNAGKLAKASFGEYGPAGGHKEAARAECPVKNLPLREGKEFTSKTLIRILTQHTK